MTIEADSEGHPRLTYDINTNALNRIVETHLGKTILISNRAEWSDEQIIEAYRSQFLIEAVMLSVLGGFIGILVGSGVALAMPYVAGWTTVLPWQAILIAFGVSAVIGMFFGIYPARRASLLDPITALRYE